MEAAWRAAFEAMPAEDLVETLRDFGELVREKEREAYEMREELLLGMRVAYARGLVL